MDGDTRAKRLKEESSWHVVNMVEWIPGWQMHVNGIVDWKNVGQNTVIRLRCGGTTAEHRIVGSKGMLVGRKRNEFKKAITELTRQFQKAGVYGVIETVKPICVQSPAKKAADIRYQVIQEAKIQSQYQDAVARQNRLDQRKSELPQTSAIQ